MNNSHPDSNFRTEIIKKITFERGYAYIAKTKHNALSSHLIPSHAIVLEDSVPLPGPANENHDEIRKLGGGRYSFWYDNLYFSSSDNSDPRTNGRKYEIQFNRSIVFILPKKPSPSDFYNLLNHWLATNNLKQSFQTLLNKSIWEMFYFLCYLCVLNRRKKGD